MTLDGKEYKGVYIPYNGFWADRYCFSKKYFTKEQAIEKFKEINPKRELGEIRETFIRFLWITYIIEDYEDGSYPESVGDFFEVKKGGKGAIDCWCITSKKDPDEFWV